MPDWIDKIRGELDRVIAEEPEGDEPLAARWSMTERAPARAPTRTRLERGRAKIGKPSPKRLSA